MDIELLHKIMDAYHTYQEGLPVGHKTSLKDFTIWVNNEDYATELTPPFDKNDLIGRQDIDVEISKLLLYLYRYAKLHIRNGMNDYPELINEDFTYLYTLMTAESMTKTQLIEKNIHEKPTGLEIIKRLLKHHLIEEKDDEADKRSKRVRLTEKGRQLFFKSLDRTNNIAKVITGKLDINEKRHLFGLLKKLDAFHNPKYKAKQHLSIDELVINYGLN